MMKKKLKKITKLSELSSPSPYGQQYIISASLLERDDPQALHLGQLKAGSNVLSNVFGIKGSSQ
jgi:hypothetical protein